MDKQVLNLLRKYLNNQCTADELEQIRDILQNNKYEEEWNRALYEDTEKIMGRDIFPSLDSNTTDQLLQRIVQNTNPDKASTTAAPGRWWLRIAATVLIFLTAGLVFTLLLFPDDLSRTITDADEQTEILLADGTRILLKDQSTLSYPDEFNGDTRTVQLDGSAFFDVASNPSQPFLVQTDELTIRVLGTSFDVSAYKNDRDVSVSVASGSVSVTGPPAAGNFGEPSNNLNEKPVNKLKPGDRLTYDRLIRKYHQQTMSFEDIRALNGERLIFQNQTIGDISKALERRYNIQFRFEEDMSTDQRLTFKPNSSDLDEVLQVLSLVSGFEYEMSDSEVYMIKK